MMIYSNIYVNFEVQQLFNFRTKLNVATEILKAASFRFLPTFLTFCTLPYFS